MIRLRRPRHDRVTLRCERWQAQCMKLRHFKAAAVLVSQARVEATRHERERLTKLLHAEDRPGVHVFCPQGVPKMPRMQLAIPERVRLSAGAAIPYYGRQQIVEIEARQHRFQFATRDEFDRVELAFWTWEPVR